MKPQIAVAAVIGLSLAANATALAQQIAPVVAHSQKFAGAMPKPPLPGKFAGPAAPGANRAPLHGHYHHRVHVTDQAGNSAAPKLVNDLAGPSASQRRFSSDRTAFAAR